MYCLYQCSSKNIKSSRDVCSIQNIKICKSVYKKAKKFFVVKIFKKRFFKGLIFCKICKTWFHITWKVCMFQTMFGLMRLTTVCHQEMYSVFQTFKVAKAFYKKTKKFIVVKFLKKQFDELRSQPEVVKGLIFCKICKTCFRITWKVCMVQTIHVLMMLTTVLLIPVFIEKHKVINRCI